MLKLLPSKESKESAIEKQMDYRKKAAKIEKRTLYGNTIKGSSSNGISIKAGHAFFAVGSRGVVLAVLQNKCTH